VLGGLSACSASSLKTRLKPAFDVVYVDYTPGEPAELAPDSTAGPVKCEPQRPPPESMIERAFSRRTMLPAELLTRMDADCKTTTIARRGGDLIVVARQGDWLFVQETSENKEGWISSEFLQHGFNENWNKTNECIDLEWSLVGLRVKNVCDRDISDFWICFAGKDRKSCATKWYQIGRLDAGKTDVLHNLPRHTSSWWFWKICFEPGRVDPSVSGYPCT